MKAKETHFLELRNVAKTFKLPSGDVTALEKVSLSISRGELIALVGPSGSGKTTLLNIIGSLDRPSEGEVALEGQRIDQLFKRDGDQLLFVHGNECVTPPIKQKGDRAVSEVSGVLSIKVQF